jgi:hypothetical protein
VFPDSEAVEGVVRTLRWIGENTEQIERDSGETLSIIVRVLCILSDAPSTGCRTHWPSVFIFQELFGTPELARFYTGLLINSPTTVTTARDRQGSSKSTACNYANALAELGVQRNSTSTRTGRPSGVLTP